MSTNNDLIHLTLGAIAELHAVQRVSYETATPENTGFDETDIAFFNAGESNTPLTNYPSLYLLQEHGISLTRPVLALQENPRYVCASIGTEVIQRIGLGDICTDNAQELIAYVEAAQEEILHAQLVRTEQAMACVYNNCTLDTVAAAANAETTLNILIAEFSQHMTPALKNLVHTRQAKAIDDAVAILQETGATVQQSFAVLTDSNAPEFASAHQEMMQFYDAITRIYGMHPLITRVMDRYKETVQEPVFAYLNTEFKITQGLMRTAPIIAAKEDTPALTALVTAITERYDSMRRTLQATHDCLTADHRRAYAKQLSDLEQDPTYTAVTATLLQFDIDDTNPRIETHVDETRRRYDFGTLVDSGVSPPPYGTRTVIDEIVPPSQNTVGPLRLPLASTDAPLAVGLYNRETVKRLHPSQQTN